MSAMGTTIQVIDLSQSPTLQVEMTGTCVCVRVCVCARTRVCCACVRWPHPLSRRCAHPMTNSSLEGNFAKTRDVFTARRKRPEGW